MATFEIVVDGEVHKQTFDSETDDEACAYAAQLRRDQRQVIVVRKRAESDRSTGYSRGETQEPAPAAPASPPAKK